MSVFVPYHLTTLPCSSRTGTARNKNQRYVPSNARKRAASSPGSPDASRPSHVSISCSRSSGWMATFHPQSTDASMERPVYSSQRWFTNSLVPSGRQDHASLGILSIIMGSSSPRRLIVGKEDSPWGENLRGG